MRVALALHQSPPAVAAWPVLWVALTYLHVLRADRAAAVQASSRTIEMGGVTALAFHEPKRLGDEHRALVASARAAARRSRGLAAVEADRAATRATADRILAQAEKLGWTADVPRSAPNEGG